MLPKAQELRIDFEALGQKMLERKKELKEDGIPADAEHAMVKKANGKSDSPASASRKTVPAARKTAKKASPSVTAKSGRAHGSH
jgi:hypothetical protein